MIKVAKWLFSAAIAVVAIETIDYLLPVDLSRENVLWGGGWVGVVWSVVDDLIKGRHSE